MRCQATGKVRHATKDGAEVTRRKLNNVQLNVFQCRRCNGWHLGNSRSPARLQKRFDQILGIERHHIRRVVRRDRTVEYDSE